MSKSENISWCRTFLFVPGKKCYKWSEVEYWLFLGQLISRFPVYCEQYWSPGEAGGEGTPYNGLYGEDPLAGGDGLLGVPFSSFKYIWTGSDFTIWNIWKDRISAIMVYKKDLKRLTGAFHGCEKVEKTCWFFFSFKNGNKRARGWTSGRRLQYKTLLNTPRVRSGVS